MSIDQQVKQVQAAIDAGGLIELGSQWDNVKALLADHKARGERIAELEAGCAVVVCDIDNANAEITRLKVLLLELENDEKYVHNAKIANDWEDRYEIQQKEIQRLTARVQELEAQYEDCKRGRQGAWDARDRADSDLLVTIAERDNITQERDALRAFAQEIRRAFNISAWKELRQFGLIDDRDQPTPLLTGEPDAARETK